MGAKISAGGASGAMPHAMQFGYVSAEACINAINSGSATGQMVLNIAMMDCENIDNDHVNDSGNFLYGVVNITTYSQALAQSGGTNLTINSIQT